jgi:hypothetical protein
MKQSTYIHILPVSVIWFVSPWLHLVIVIEIIIGMLYYVYEFSCVIYIIENLCFFHVFYQNLFLIFYSWVTESEESKLFSIRNICFKQGFSKYKFICNKSCTVKFNSNNKTYIHSNTNNIIFYYVSQLRSSIFLWNCYCNSSRILCRKCVQLILLPLSSSVQQVGWVPLHVSYDILCNVPFLYSCLTVVLMIGSGW